MASLMPLSNGRPYATASNNPMQLHHHLNSFGQYLRARHGRRVQKLALNVGFSCPNRDGSKGRGGCTFCNNASFTPHARQAPSLSEQLSSGRAHMQQLGTTRYLAYFQAYTNTYADVETLDELYRSALQHQDIVGLAIGTREHAVLDLLVRYQEQGYEVWLELGLQSAFDSTLRRVNRGHGYAEYLDAVRRARRRSIPLCTHLIVGLPGEQAEHSLCTINRVIDAGVDGLKLHPLHVVKGSQLANEWRRGEYQPMRFIEYVNLASEMIRRTPTDVLFHRVTATAQNQLLLAPDWCAHKWPVMNAIGENLARHGGQGHARSSR